MPKTKKKQDREYRIGCGQIAASTGQLCKRINCRGGHPILTAATATLDGKKMPHDMLMQALSQGDSAQAAPAYRRSSKNDHPVTGARCLSVSRIINDTSPKHLQNFDVRHISGALADGRLDIFDQGRIDSVWEHAKRHLQDQRERGVHMSDKEIADFVYKLDADLLYDTTVIRDIDDIRQQMRTILREATGSAIGTEAHSVIQSGASVDTLRDTRAANMVTAARDWMEESGCEIVDQEFDIWGDDFQGRVDALGIVDGEYAIIDWKTTLGDDLKIYPDAQVQVAAYAAAEPYPDGWPGGKAPTKGYVVRVSANGEHFATEVDCSPDSTVMRAWEVMKEYAYIKERLEIAAPEGD